MSSVAGREKSSPRPDSVGTRRDEKNRRFVSYLHKRHQTRLGLAIGGLIELAGAYAIGSWAIDAAGWWRYAIMLILIVGALQNFVRLVGPYVHDHDNRKTTKA